ncbi:unnamed protein product [Owenia fusiformis]|uniref:TIR domain-containing protein n=1 Tax=Owenia fusiformis TaxID=6347 RepID=A0A8S4PS72_OWEFU|nr:unnamed protein product [Owenia fusiformis]
MAASLPSRSISVAEKPQQYDFYLCYNQNDENDAWKLCKALEEIELDNGRKIQGFIDCRDGHPGKSIFSNMGEALQLSKKVLVLLTENSMCEKAFTSDKEGALFEFKVHTTLQISMEDFVRGSQVPGSIGTYVVPVFNGFSPKRAPPLMKNLFGIDLQQNNPFTDVTTKFKKLFSPETGIQRTISYDSL